MPAQQNENNACNKSDNKTPSAKQRRSYAQSNMLSKHHPQPMLHPLIQHYHATHDHLPWSNSTSKFESSTSTCHGHWKPELLGSRARPNNSGSQLPFGGEGSKSNLMSGMPSAFVALACGNPKIPKIPLTPQMQPGNQSC